MSCIVYIIHSFANTASAYEPRSTCIAPWLSPSCSMTLKYGPPPSRSPPPRRDRYALSKASPGCVLAGSTSATKASVNAPNNQPHHPSHDNAACAGSDISTACHSTSLYEEYVTSIQTSMVGRDQEAAPKPDGLIQSSTTSSLLASTPSMLSRWYLTDPSGRPLFAGCQRSNPSKALKSSKSIYFTP